MMKQRVVYWAWLLCGMSLLFSSCGESYDNTESYFLHFSPRKVTHVGLVPGIKTLISYELNDGGVFTGYEYKLLETKQVEGQAFFLALCTSNVASDIGQFRGHGSLDNVDADNGFPGLESLMERDYRAVAATRMNLVPMEYRLTSLDDVVLTADKPLFGIPAGMPLNECLRIEEYLPDCICGSNKQLLYGFGDKSKPATLDAWLRLKALAQPAMYLGFTSVPDELPQEVSFSLSVTTADGDVLTHTTDPIEWLR